MQVKSYIERPIPAKQVKELYNHIGWWEEREESDIQRMLEQGISVGAWQGNELIGFARAVTYGKFRAYIEDVVIHNDYQKSGIGKDLVSFLLEELSHIDVISLFCESELIPFYETNSFKHSKKQVVMHRK
ncbi:N-acetyltransferase [Ornithinibacillus halotolerans]|uniref:N-acetyltransferase n=2 Tax=Ornithinibacillus halotolerans TaxID=1274357 RepID=A0A916RV66_9BACI|nr:N-acetyltransferase [Ornithinibacillus halotolerans]